MEAKNETISIMEEGVKKVTAGNCGPYDTTVRLVFLGRYSQMAIYDGSTYIGNWQLDNGKFVKLSLVSGKLTVTSSTTETRMGMTFSMADGRQIWLNINEIVIGTGDLRNATAIRRKYSLDPGNNFVIHCSANNELSIFTNQSVTPINDDAVLFCN